MNNIITKLAFILYLSVTALNVKSQENLILNSYSGQAEIKATKSITLNPGFHATGNVRIYIQGVSFLNCSPLTAVPSSNQNYIVSRLFKMAGVDTSNINDPHSICQENQVIQYIDGLGRPLQTVSVNGSLPGHDLIQPFAYDAFGREQVKYQPYSVWNNNGGYRADAISGGQAAYYVNPPSGVKGTNTPYSLTVYEASPAGRVIEQGAPGDAWQPISGTNIGHTVKVDYSTNAGDVKMWTITTSGAVATSSYSEGKLSRTNTKSENWTQADGLAGTTDEYKDFQDRIVLKKFWETNTKSLNTYYIYDDQGNIRYILPPAVNENTDRLSLAISSFNESQTEFTDFIYAYHYDGRNRLIEKKIPGKAWEQIVYNPLDQIVFTQDGIQKQHNERAYMKYDAFGRIIMTGIEIDHVDTRANLQNTVNALTTFWDTRDNSTSNLHGYNNLSAPSNLTNIRPQVVNYYDDYNIPGIPFPYSAEYSNKTQGLLTASKVKVLGSANDFLWTVNFYDDDGRLIRVFDQHYLAGLISAANYDEILNSYNFAGELTLSTRIHHTTQGNTAIVNRYEYDHLGRRLATMEDINGQGEVVLSKLDYNEIGQLKNKNLYAPLGSSFLNSTSFSYNERGWLTNSSNNLFSMQLAYQENGSGMYNGNISRQSWSSNANALSSNVYVAYGYDKINRLLTSNSSGITMSEILTYDVMGNINTLKRDGGNPNKYHYNGNKLWYTEYVTNGYDYDENGNARVDGRKGFNIQYNQLNLPSVISNGTDITFVYDANGRKLKKATAAGHVNYVNGIQYKTNGTIDFIQTEEGLARNNGSSQYSYEYNLSDHLGNNRVTFYKNPVSNVIEVIQRDDFYAFGLRKVAVQGNNKYLYNNKELQEELGQYDYGARFYDPVIGRFNVIDRFVEKYNHSTPYSYTANNPISNIDINGDSINVAIMQIYDKVNGTNYVNQIIKDLQLQTGLVISIESNGQLNYAKDPLSGEQLVDIQMGSSNTLVEVGSSEARNLIKGAIDNTVTAYGRITSSGSSATVGGSLININPGQVNSFINGANNLDSRALGFGMTFMHELTHSGLGGGLIDPAASAGFGPTGPTVDRMNIIQGELNVKGGNYGQRSSYQAIKLSSSGPAYLPFDTGSLRSLQSGIVPAHTNKYIKF